MNFFRPALAVDFCKATASIKSFYYIDSVIRKIYSFSDLYCIGNFIYCF